MLLFILVCGSLVFRYTVGFGIEGLPKVGMYLLEEWLFPDNTAHPSHQEHAQADAQPHPARTAQSGRGVEVAPFHQVQIQTPFEVQIRQAPRQHIEFDGSDELFEQLSFEVQNGVLRIGQRKRKGNSWWRNYGNRERAVIYIEVPDLKEIDFSGSGFLRVEEFETGRIELAVRSSGGAEVELACTQLEAMFSGSGTFDLLASVQQLELEVSGSGNTDIQVGRGDRYACSFNGSGDYRLEAEAIQLSIDKNGSGGLLVGGKASDIRLDTHGSGEVDMVRRGVLQAEDLRINRMGSGRMELEVDCHHFRIKSMGSGDTYLAGSAHTLEVENVGSGDIRAEDLETQVSDISLSGSGDCAITAHKRLNAKIVGSGSVRYRGHPQIDRQVLGSGDIRGI